MEERGSDGGQMRGKLRGATIGWIRLTSSPMRLTVLGVVAALTALTVATGLAPAHLAPVRRVVADCGSAYGRLKTLGDRQRKLVKLRPKDTTLGAIAERARPKITPASRNTSFERQVWRLPAQITDVKLADDGGIKLVLFDAGVYGIAEMPDARCLPKRARGRNAIVDVRQRFVSACGQPTKSWKPLGAVVIISGVGFWDRPYNAVKQHAPNFAELHPVTVMQIVAGCR
jgi:hypothetical protein